MRFPGVIPAITTPFDARGEVDLDALKGNARALLDAGLTGLVGNGTMGEAGSLSAAERRAVIEGLVDAADGRATSPPVSPPRARRPRSPTPRTPRRPARAR